MRLMKGRHCPEGAERRVRPESVELTGTLRSRLGRADANARRRFGISDVGLAKTCRRHRIPCPPRGYWQKKRHGRSVRRVPLRTLKPGEEDLDRVRLSSNDSRSQEEAGPVADQRKYEAEHPISVPDRMGRAHPLVAATREYFKRARRGYGTNEERRRAKRHGAAPAIPRRSFQRGGPPRRGAFRGRGRGPIGARRARAGASWRRPFGPAACFAS